MALKALPYVVDWFERAQVAISNDDGLWHHYETAWHNIDAKVLSAIYLFAKKMPLSENKKEMIRLCYDAFVYYYSVDVLHLRAVCN